MPIEIDEQGPFSQQFFVSPQDMAYPIGDQNYAADKNYTIVRSGIVLLPNESRTDAENAGRSWTPQGFQGTTQSQWRGDRLILNLDIGRSINRLGSNLPPNDAGFYWAFRMDQGIPFASLNSVYNAGPSNYAGSSVNNFAIHQPKPDELAVNLQMDIAVRDTDGYLFRIGFYVALLGHIYQQDS